MFWRSSGQRMLVVSMISCISWSFTCLICLTVTSALTVVLVCSELNKV